MSKATMRATDELRDDELDGASGGIIAILIGLLLPAPPPPPAKP